MEQKTKSESEAMTESTVHLIIGEVLNYKDAAEQLSHGEWYAQHNETAFKIAMAVAKFYEQQVDVNFAAVQRLTAENEELNAIRTELRAEIEAKGKHIKQLQWDKDKLVDDLTIFQSFADETPITEDWLAKYFEKKDYSYEYSDEYVEIEIKEHSDSIWRVDVTSIELDYHTDKCQVSYLGQLRQFLTLCGQGEFAKQLK